MGQAIITGLPDAEEATGVELIEVSQPSPTIRITAATISAQASDNSFNDSAAGFVAAGFAVGHRVGVAGFTGNVANNIKLGVITVLTAGKMTIGGTDGDVIVDDAAGESVTIFRWVSRRMTAQEIADLAGSGLPPGGDDGQVLGKLSAADFDAGWIDQTGGGGGGGGGGVVFSGALINRAANLALVAATDTTATFDTENYDTDGYYDAGAPTRLTVPSGVTRVQLATQLNGASATGQLYAEIWKNGATFVGAPIADTDTLGGDGVNLVSAPIDVVPGDYFQLRVYSEAARNVTFWMSIRAVDGALVTPSSGGGSGGGGLFDVSMGVPDLADFTAVGATYATYSENSGLGINIKNTSSVGATSTLLGLTKPIPAPTFHVCSLQLPQVSRLDFWRPAMGVFNSANGRFETVSMNIDSSTNGQIERASWTAYDNRSSFSAVDGPRAIGPFWMHVKYDGTNIFFGYSFDGANPFWAFTRVLADWIGAITDIFVGMFALTSGALNGQNNTILCWDEDGDARVMGVAQGGGGGSSPYTPPLVADFPTAYNIASNCQTADTAEGLAFTVEASATTINRGLLKAAPAAPYSVTWKQRASFSSNAADDVIGIVIRDSATDRLMTWGPNVISNLVLQRWNSATSYSGNVIQTGNAAVADMCFRLVDNGTNFLFQIGPTVEGPWVTWRTESRTTWCANPDQIGINIEEQSGHGHYFQVMEHWIEA